MARVRLGSIAALFAFVTTVSVWPAAPRTMATVLAAAVTWPTSTLVISEAQTGGASASDEFVEIANQGLGPVDLAGLEVAYATSSGSTVTRKATWSASTVLEPGRRVLIANAAGSFAPVADATYTGGFAVTGGALVLRVVGGAPVDALGWGDATNAFVEATAAPPPGSGSSLERAPGGSGGNGSDTNDNSVDFFVTATPSPQGSTATPVPAPVPTPTPTPTPPATPTPTPGLTPVPLPTPTPTPLPTPTPTPTAKPSPTPTAKPTPTPAPTPTPTPTAAPSPALGSIAAARALPVGTTVTLRGTVMAEAGRTGIPGLVAIGDETGGIGLRLPTSVVAPARGAFIEVRGKLAAPFGQLEIRPAVDTVTGLASGTLPDPVTIGNGGLGEATEGRLVVVTGQLESRPTKVSGGDLSLVLERAGAASIKVMADASSGVSAATFQVGATYRITGIVGQRATHAGAIDGYRLWLRDAADIVRTAAPVPTATPTPTPSKTPHPSSSASSRPTSGPIVVVSIARARAITDRSVAIVAVVTAPSTLLDSSGRRIVAQDGSGSIEVRLPADAKAPSIGVRIRAEGTVGRAYGAPRLQADRIVRLGTSPQPTPLILHASPTEPNEWRLVTLTGRIEVVRKLGDRWRAELSVGASRVIVIGRSGSRIPESSLLKGHQATVIGIVQRPYPTATDRRYVVLPRQPSDLRVDRTVAGGPGPSGGPAGAPAGGPGSNAGAASATQASASGAAVVATPDADLAGLAGLIGVTVRVGGLVTDLQPGGFRLDDGTAVGTVVLRAAAADLLPLIESGDAINVTGRVESTPSGPIVAVEDPATVSLAGDPTAASPASDAGSTTPGDSDRVAGPTIGHRAADFAPFPGGGAAGAAGLGTLVGLTAASLVVTILRRRHLRARLTARMATRRAAAVGPSPGPVAGAGGPRSAEHDPRSGRHA